MLHTGLPSCPWRLQEHPLCGDVLRLYGAREMTDPVALAGGDGAPNVLVEALLHFDRCISAVRAHERDREERSRASRQSSSPAWTASKTR
ncbi:MAG: hypothetical protein IT379_23590 [Deltaproteobacteria bacterium]|nr:hypothetical protein [Deltaproteobacteria bacterium]